MFPPRRRSRSAWRAEATGAGRPFYGWLVVAACFGILFVAYGVQFSYGVFLPAMAAETGWDRTSLSLAFSIYVFVYSILGAATGWCTDRFGPRLVIGCGAVLLGGGLLLTSRVEALWQLYLALGLFAALGMSAIYVPCNATVVRWFVWRRGLALGIASSGHGFGNLLIPTLAALLMAGYGWRATYALLALVGATLILLCALVMVRDPERMGLHADGIEPAAAPEEAAARPAPTSARPLADAVWTLAAARRTAALWLVTAIFTMTFLVIFMPMVHLVPFALDLGIPPVRAALAVGLIGAGSLAGRLLSGAVSDRLGRPSTLGLALALQALAFGGFWAATGAAQLFPSALLFGFATGATSTLFPAIVGDFFGRLSVGAIFGFVWAIAASAAAFGPLIAGYLYDLTGSYGDAFALGAALNLAAACLVVLLRKPGAPEGTFRRPGRGRRAGARP